MASTAAISVLGRAILGLLAQSCPRSEWEGAQFELYLASNFKTPMAEGVSLYLYRVAPSGVRRNMAPRLDPDGHRQYRPSLPVELHYLLTPWARSAERQHQLLGWAMRTLDDMPTLDATFLNAFAPSGEDTFHADEGITLVFESVSVQDMFNIWEIIKPNIQVSASYQVSFVALDSARELVEYPPVQRRVLRPGKLVP
jgi:hypothetical protein